MIDIFTKGFVVSGGLIVAIGSQNAFVLKQGLLRQHISSIIAICFICDSLLITSGVLGLGYILKNIPWLATLLAALGSLFLFWYGASAFRKAWHGGDSLNLTDNLEKKSHLQIVSLTLALTLLNPHVYLDTLIIIGGVGGTLAETEKPWFLFGALVASFTWFTSLGFGARLLTPLFKKPRTWQILETLIGIMMWWIAIELVTMFIVK